MLRARLRKLLPALNTGVRYCLRHPYVPLTVVSAGFYLFHSAHLPFLLWVLICAPIIALNGLVLWLGWRVLVPRISGEAIRPWPEFLVGALLVFLIQLDFLRFPFYAAVLPLVFLGWLAWQMWHRKSGAFYTGLLALVFFLLVVNSYRVIYLEVRAVLFARYHLLRMQAVEEMADRVPRWEEETIDGRRMRVLYERGARVLALPMFPGSYFHDGRLIAFSYEMPQPGSAYAFVSASETDPFSPPTLAIFEVDLDDTVESIADNARLTLDHRENGGEIDDVREVSGAREMVAGIESPGHRFVFRDIVFQETIAWQIFLTESIHGRRYAVMTSEEIDDATATRQLQRIRFFASAE